MRTWLAVAALAVAPVGLAADVLIAEKTTVTAGSRIVDGTRSTYIRDARMRIESIQGDTSTTTVYDLPAGVTIGLDATKKRAELRDIASRNAELQREYPRERVEISLTPTGATREIGSESCDEHAFTIRVPMSKDGSLALLMTGSAWMAKGAPGAADYATFAKAAVERGVVLGSASSNKVLLAMTRAQTELYRALAGAGGIPYVVDMRTRVDGKGLLASMVGKALTGARMSTVTEISSAPLADEVFVIPENWKREKK